MSMIGFLAHSNPELQADIARMAVSMAVALMTQDHRLCLHVSPDIAVPLLLAGEMSRVQLVVESPEQGPPPIVMMPGPAPEGPEAALFSKVEIGRDPLESDSESIQFQRTSLMDRFSDLGIADARWLGNRDVPMYKILTEEQPRLIVAIGWSWQMKEVVEASEDYAREQNTPLLFVDTGWDTPMNKNKWRPLDSFVDSFAPNITFSSAEDIPLSEELIREWDSAQRRAAQLLAAELLASTY